MRLLWLPAVLRAAGLTVHEVSGWKTRGGDQWGPIRGLTCHHTAGSRTSTDAGEIRTLVQGSKSAPAPIAQLYLSRTGAWHVVASGICWHNLTGWGGPNRGHGNSTLIGVEAQHSGGDEPWTSRQYDSYVTGVAAIMRHLKLPAARVAGHKEHQPGAKNDPTFNMNSFRDRVAAAIKGDDVTKDDIKAAVLAALSEPVQLAGGHADRLKAAGWNTKRSVLDWLGYLAENALLADRANVEQILKAISDDPDAPLVIDPEDLAAVADQLAARLAPAVADEQARRLAS